MTAAITGVIVAIVAGVFGIGGAVLAGRREHEKWLRQQRLAAYVKLLAVVGDATGSSQTARTAIRSIGERVDEVDPERRGDVEALIGLMTKDHLTRMMTVPDALVEASSVVRLLGPRSIENPAQTLFRAALDDFLEKPEASTQRIIDAERAFIEAAQEGLSSRR